MIWWYERPMEVTGCPALCAVPAALQVPGFRRAESIWRSVWRGCACTQAGCRAAQAGLVGWGLIGGKEGWQCATVSSVPSECSPKLAWDIPVKTLRLGPLAGRLSPMLPGLMHIGCGQVVAWLTPPFPDLSSLQVVALAPSQCTHRDGEKRGRGTRSVLLLMGAACTSCRVHQYGRCPAVQPVVLMIILLLLLLLLLT